MHKPSLRRSTQAWLVFFAIGVVQALQFSWFFQSVLVFASQRQAFAAVLPSLAFLSLPYSVKWLFALCADYAACRGYAYRHGVMVILGLLASLWCCMGLWCGDGLWFWVAMTVASLLGAHLDVWVDAHRIRDYPSAYQSATLQANVFGFRLGFGFLSGFFMLLSNDYGWSLMFYSCAVLNLVSLALLHWAQMDFVPDRQDFCLAGTRLFEWRLLLGSIVLRSADGWINSVLTFYLIYVCAWGSESIGMVLQILGGIASLLGILCAPYLKYPLSRLMRYNLLVSTCFVFLWAGCPSGSPNWVSVLIVLWCFWMGISGFIFSQWMTRHTCPKMPGTHFSMMTSLARLPSVGGVAWGGVLMKEHQPAFAFMLGLVGVLLSACVQWMSDYEEGDSRCP